MLRALFRPIERYTHWLHTRWPAGTVEKLPEIREDGSTVVPGLYVAGDLTGIPLLKFSADSGARAVRTILADERFQKARGSRDSDNQELVIVGAGVAGMAAALEAKKSGLDFVVLEASEPFSTIVNFPRGKPIYTYPRDMMPAGELQFTAEVKEDLVEELGEQTSGIETRTVSVERIRARGGLLEVELSEGEQLRGLRVVVAIGRSGSFRKLEVPGEELGKVTNRLHDPRDYCNQDVLVVGGGDSAVETAIAVAGCGGRVTLSYRKGELTRPKPENVDKLHRLVRDPGAPVAVEEPVSERVTAAMGEFLRDEGAPRGSLRLEVGSRVKEIGEADATLVLADGSAEAIPNDAVFTMIGRNAPLGFFRRSGVPILGEWRARTWISLLLFVLFCVFLYHWKSDAGFGVKTLLAKLQVFPFALDVPESPEGLVNTLRLSLREPSFYYTFAYCLCVVVFGIDRIRRRKTPYVKLQTLVLMAVQCVPLFLLPYIALPWAGHGGFFGERYRLHTIPAEKRNAWAEMLEDQAEGSDLSGKLQALGSEGLLPEAVIRWEGAWANLEWSGRVVVRAKGPEGARREAVLQINKGRGLVTDESLETSWVADQLFPASEWSDQGREYWRATGFILAWPLMVWNVFTDQPMMLWLVIGFVQTFVLIPLLIWRWGKGAYCGWICSCGALAETLGDRHRHKMPHGPIWNRVNMVGQVALLFAVVLLVARVVSWLAPEGSTLAGLGRVVFMAGLYGRDASWQSLGLPWSMLSYEWLVDLFLAGIVGVGLYFHFSGRVWCRFACPLAALMHVYTRFSRFRIFAEKKKCISCNVCTSVCHQGIDIMSFANKGLPMEDPECVRCSACVQSCPTGVLSFGRLGKGNGVVLDTVVASPVRMREGQTN